MKNLKKRILSLITAAAVAFSAVALPDTGILPDLSVTASAETEFTEAATWTALKNALTAGGDVRLTGNVTAGNSDTALVVPSGKTVTLDLNGHTIDRGLKDEDAVSSGNVITVRGNLTLTDSSTGGTITGGKTTVNGGGVYVYEGTFTMNGGTISDCLAKWGGGVYVNGGEFTMQGGTISGCSASWGGGVYVNDGEFTMSGGTISGCSASYGGGVYAKNGATFTMQGGTISGCSSTGWGGGVYVDDTFTMSGGTISGCSAGGYGGGVYVGTNSTFNVSGAPVISGNTEDNAVNEDDAANNVVFQSSHPTKTINVIDKLTADASIYVHAEKNNAVAVGSGGYNLAESDAEYFHSDNSRFVPVFVTEDNTNKVKLVGAWGALQSKLNNASTDEASPTTITLSDDFTADSTDTALVVPAGKYVTLDLNGHTIDRGLKDKDAVEDGNVITVNGNLTLTDSSDNPETAEYDGTGIITGGKTTGNGGGVSVSEDGTFTMSGGTISGCSAHGYGYGGGVCVDKYGTFTMQGGMISECKTTDDYGGGVYVNGGKFTMQGGTISGCFAAFGGGGVCVYGTFTMQGGTISGCSVYSDGGGVYVKGKFNVSGSPVISGNTAGGAANNVVATNTINVTGELTKGASIYVTAEKGVAFAVGSSYTIKASDTEYFHSDIDTELPSVLVTDDYMNKVKFAGAWGALQSKLDNASTDENAPTTITLSGNVTAEDGDTTLVVHEGKYVTLDLNGHTIDRGLKDKEAVSDGNVITVNGNLTLTDTSTGEPGTITGGNNDGGTYSGGGVYVWYGGTFSMNGGTISDCSENNNGGGVYVDGTFTMNGGTISD